MFPDSKIAQIFQLGPDKLKYYYNLGIVPYFKDVFKEMQKKSNLYVICFDESLNVAQNCQMDVLIRYFDSVDRRVKMWYLDSRFLSHSTHRDLLDQYNTSLQVLDNSKIGQISMDGQSVNLKFLQKVQDDKVENEQPALIDSGSYCVHTVGGAFKCRAQSTGWKLKVIRSGSYQILHDSTARRDDCQSVINSLIYPWKFCATW